MALVVVGEDLDLAGGQVGPCHAATTIVVTVFISLACQQPSGRVQQQSICSTAGFTEDFKTRNARRVGQDPIVGDVAEIDSSLAGAGGAFQKRDGRGG